MREDVSDVDLKLWVDFKNLEQNKNINCLNELNWLNFITFPN